MRRNRGVALVTVLFILALMATLAVYMIEDEYMALRRTGNMYEAEQARQMAMGSERWAVKVLERDRRETETDHLNESWNRLGSLVTVEEGTLTTVIEDQQGRFNLNNLQAGKDTVWYPAFVRLLQLLELEEGLANAVIDWIDADHDTSGSSGAEDNDYLAREPPYRSANRIFNETSELLWVAGFDQERLAKLAPFVTALPAGNVPINVNTCAVVLLRILGKDILSEAAAESLVAGRGEEGYQSVDDFLTMPELAAQGDVASKLVGLSSNYFTVSSQARYGRITLTLESLVHRTKESGKTRVLQRRRGV